MGRTLLDKMGPGHVEAEPGASEKAQPLLRAPPFSFPYCAADLRNPQSGPGRKKTKFFGDEPACGTLKSKVS